MCTENSYKIFIDKNEVLRYLGVKKYNQNDLTYNIIDECIEEIKNLAVPSSVIKYSKVEKDSKVYLKDLSIDFNGEDILNHLENAKGCYVLAATLGINIDKRILFYERTDMTRAIIFNACATTAIENYCDFLDDGVKEIAKKEGKSTTWRYSPGYGDFDLSVQGQILNSLDTAKRIGLTTTPHNILIPRKSVTAFIGIVDKENEIKKRGCADCNKFKDCEFRKSGVRCGN